LAGASSCASRAWGAFPVFKRGRSYVARRADVDAYIERQRVEVAPPLAQKPLLAVWARSYCCGARRRPPAHRQEASMNRALTRHVCSDGPAWGKDACPNQHAGRLGIDPGETAAPALGGAASRATTARGHGSTWETGLIARRGAHVPRRRQRTTRSGSAPRESSARHSAGRS
jgi:hypothetical protein